MKNVLFATAAVALLAASAPALAQSPGGASRADVAPSYWGHGEGTYFGDCRLVEDQIVTKSGRVIVRTRQACD
jgi:hypothetical protein